MSKSVFLYYAKEFLIKELQSYIASSLAKDNSFWNSTATLLSGYISEPLFSVTLGRDFTLSQTKRSFADDLIDSIRDLHLIKDTDGKTIETIENMEDKEAYEKLKALIATEKLKDISNKTYLISLNLMEKFLNDLYESFRASTESSSENSSLLNIPFVEYKKGSDKEIDKTLSNESNPLRVFEYNIAAYFYEKLVDTHRPSWSTSFKTLFQGLAAEKREAAKQILHNCRKVFEGLEGVPDAKELQLIHVMSEAKLLYMQNESLCKKYGNENATVFLRAALNLIPTITQLAPTGKFVSNTIFTPGGGVLEKCVKRLLDLLESLEIKQSKKKAEDLAAQKLAEQEADALAKKKQEESEESNEEDAAKTVASPPSVSNPQTTFGGGGKKQGKQTGAKQTASMSYLN